MFHLELVESLSTESFMAAIGRFVARRGLVHDVYTDNATNFVGSYNEIKEIYKFMEVHSNELSESLALLKMRWHFSPPSAPHFNGLTEAAVKSFKKHFYKVACDSSLTYVEMNSLIIEIEGILNSRPITQLSSDPNDLTCLTPAHFLIGSNLFFLPEVNLMDEKLNYLSLWQRTQQLRQHFWKRWQADYLQELQRRQKWRSGDSKMTVGKLVII